MVTVYRSGDKLYGKYFIYALELNDFIKSLREGLMDENGVIYNLNPNALLHIRIEVLTKHTTVSSSREVPTIKFDTEV